MQIVEDICDSISKNPEESPLSETEKPESDKRLESYRQNPSKDKILWHKQKKD
jgi:putative addiction module component (TIGR02574 family)